MKSICRTLGVGLVDLGLFAAALTALGGAAYAEARGLDTVVMAHKLAPAPAALPLIAPAAAEPKPVLVWTGADIDGDGQADFENPTGKRVRAHDAYGDGAFGASRDGGAREHEGVDFDAAKGQAVDAPISGYVTKIGLAYPDDQRFKFVEITNPALHYMTRVFYVDPAVREGQTVHMGDPIGHAHGLQQRYPGITDHVHLEVARLGGRRLNAQTFITARYELPADAGAGTGRRYGVR